MLPNTVYQAKVCSVLAAKFSDELFQDGNDFWRELLLEEEQEAEESLLATSSNYCA